jgi:CRISPR system Cascade subunit CasD
MASANEYLIMRLWGPMVSWGSIAVGEQRQTWTRPSRSAVLGLVAAALGHERSDQAAHAALEQSLGLAIRVDRPGRHLRDYHTAQSPSREGKRRWHSRYDEVRNSEKLNTILSERAYFTEMSVVVALWRRANAAAGPQIPVIAEKLRRPTFTLYLGRKASPLGIPIQPRTIAAATLRTALTEFDTIEAELPAAAEACTRAWAWLVPDLRARGAEAADVWLSASDLADIGDCRIKERTQRRDGIRDRRTWTFDDRAEVRVRLTVEGRQ